MVHLPHFDLYSYPRQHHQYHQPHPHHHPPYPHPHPHRHRHPPRGFIRGLERFTRHVCVNRLKSFVFTTQICIIMPIWIKFQTIHNFKILQEDNYKFRHNCVYAIMLQQEMASPPLLTITLIIRQSPQKRYNQYQNTLMIFGDELF